MEQMVEAAFSIDWCLGHLKGYASTFADSRSMCWHKSPVGPTQSIWCVV
jgi:hypothetical protein